VKRTSSIVAALVLAAAGARAQEPQQPPAAQDARPAAAAPSTPSAAAALTREKLDRIYHIRQLEAMLTNAVRAGAASLANQLQVEPNSLFVTSAARARGHELEDYGVFFDVDVPTIMPSVLWSVQMRQQQQQDLYALREAVADPKTSNGVRRMAQMELRRLERALGLQSSQVTAPATPQAAPQGIAVATTTENVVPAGGRSEMSPVPALTDPSDPNELYTEAIQSKLIDAMLNFGSALRLKDTEWLTIAARATDAAPGQLDDSASILIRIKGADLNAFVLKKITRDEVLKKIEIKIG
jgi:hypothetical protein